MFKGLIVIFFSLFINLISTAFAGFYVAPTIAYESISAGQLNYEGIGPRLTVGYGDMFYTPAFYLAAEIFGSPKSIQIKRNAINGQDLKIQYNVGVSLLPGYFLDDIVLAYARLSLLSVHFKDLDINRSGTQLGAGLEAFLNASWSVRGEYDYNHYNRIYGIGAPTSNNYMIGAVYRFA